MPGRDWVKVSGGNFLVGNEDAEASTIDGEGPVRTVSLSSFEIGCTTVTNADFAEFVAATGYRTDAERIGWSFVFHTLVEKRLGKRSKRRMVGAPWWLAIDDACWRWPQGRGSHVSGKADHPVVHISWNDAVAYCDWSGSRLPSEAEWEVAARGGLVQARYPWGDALTMGNRHLCNIWQGSFPDHDTAEDGYHGTAPVRSYPPNGYGLYEVVGNVWEWCADWFTTDPVPRSGVNPHGPLSGEARVIRGGSFLCHESYCNRYRVAARSCNTPDSSASNTGFRVVAA